MGSRARLNGDECDAFSRRARKLLVWRRGEVQKIKRRFWRAQRLRTKRDADGQVREAE